MAGCEYTPQQVIEAGVKLAKKAVKALFAITKTATTIPSFAKPLNPPSASVILFITVIRPVIKSIAPTIIGNSH